MTHPLVTAVRTELAALADPAKAADMQRYMKSEMPFRGVPTPERRQLGRRLFAEHPLPDRDAWLAVVQQLWRDAECREERYLAVDLTGHRPYQRWQQADLLPLYQELIVTGAWWDYVDEIAGRRVGPILRADRTAVTPVIHGWATDADRWLRRTSVICQLGAKADTDRELLAACVEANIADPDFFLRKGIGWALREYAKTEPGWVRAFVDAHPELSPLSRREAMKHLERDAV